MPTAAATDGSLQPQFLKGLVHLTVDIERYSQKPENVQVGCMEFLDGSVRRALELEGVASLDHYYMNGTGDGVLLVLNVPDAVGDDPYLRAIRIGERILDAVDLFEPPSNWNGESLAIRVGATVGDCYWGIAVMGGRHVVGSGPNWAARITQIGDGGQLVVSEKLVDAAAQRFGNHAWLTDCLSPPMADQPHEVAVKHGKRAHFRMFLRPADRQPGAPPVVPKALLRERRLMKAVWEFMNGTLNLVVDTFGRWRLGPRVLNPRLTLWAEDPQHLGVLGPTEFRLVRGRRQAGGKSETRYRYDPLPEAVGPVGLAWALKRALAVVGLPDPDAGELEYKRAIQDYEVRGAGGPYKLRLSPADIDRWTRLSQGFLCWPVMLGDGSSPCVLCADFSAPLDVTRTGKSMESGVAHVVDVVTRDIRFGLAPLWEALSR